MFHALISGTGAMVSEFMMKDHWNLYTIVKKGYIKEVSSFFVQENKKASQKEEDGGCEDCTKWWTCMGKGISVRLLVFLP